MKHKKIIVFVLIVIIVCMRYENHAYASIIKQEVDSNGIVTYYVSNEEEKFLAFSMISARMETRSKIVYTNKYVGDSNNLYDFTDYRHYLQNNTINTQHGIGSYTGSGVTNKSNNNINIFDYSFYYFETEKQTQYVYDKIHEAIKNNIDNLQTDYQKAYFAYKWVIDNTKVDYDMSGFSSYSGIAGNGTVCQGYSTLYATIANELGLDCEIIFGGVDGKLYNHAWNVIKLNGQWYCVDAMWSDIANSDKYFLVSKDVLASSDYGYHVSSTYDNYENIGEIFAIDNYDISNEQKSNYVMPSVYNIEMDVLKNNKLVVDERYLFMISNPDNVPIIFKSENPDIATVDSNGVITGISEGSTIITVYNDNLNFSQSCTVNVSSNRID